MPGFRYRATNGDGKPLRGVIEARDLDDARLRLEGRGWKNVQVAEAVLPKPREPSRLPPPKARTGMLLLVLLLLLVAAVAAFVWFDPMHLQLLEQYGLRPAAGG